MLTSDPPSPQKSQSPRAGWKDKHRSKINPENCTYQAPSAPCRLFGEVFEIAQPEEEAAGVVQRKKFESPLSGNNYDGNYDGIENFYFQEIATNQELEHKNRNFIHKINLIRTEKVVTSIIGYPMLVLGAVGVWYASVADDDMAKRYDIGDKRRMDANMFGLKSALVALAGIGIVMVGHPSQSDAQELFRIYNDENRRHPIALADFDLGLTVIRSQAQLLSFVDSHPSQGAIVGLSLSLR